MSCQQTISPLRPARLEFAAIQAQLIPENLGPFLDHVGSPPTSRVRLADRDLVAVSLLGVVSPPPKENTDADHRSGDNDADRSPEEA